MCQSSPIQSRTPPPEQFQQQQQSPQAFSSLIISQENNFSSMLSSMPPCPPPSPVPSFDDASINGSISSISSSGTKKIKCMIIDDNDINLAILSRLLDKHFSDTIQLTSVLNSGILALDQLSRDEVDLILMDIDMPVLSGIQTTTAIRSSSNDHSILEQNKTVPIIAVTTSDADEQRELYRQVGMADCVSKPIAIPKLRMAIEQAMKSIQVSTNG